MQDVSAGTTAVLIPVKAFRSAKARLAPRLDAPARTALARDLATGVVHAARHLPVFVVCDDDGVAEWAAAVGAHPLRQSRPGLDGAAHDGVDALASAGFAWAVVAHGDLPLARDLTVVTGFEGVTVVPDRHDDGTNVLTVPTGAGFRFAYGPGSFGRHCREGARLGLGVRILRDPSLGWDVDHPEDLDHAAPAPPPGAPAR